MELALVITVVVVALVFDYINGFHDAANSIATVVSTRVLSPKVAVAWAAFFNFAAFAVLGTHDVMDVLRWKEIYGRLENAADQCEDVANTIETIVIRNS